MLSRAVRQMIREETRPIRYVVTHVAGGLRVLTFAAQGRDTYATADEAQRVLELFRDNPEGLRKVLTPGQLASLEVRAVQCYHGHHDPCRTVFED